MNGQRISIIPGTWAIVRFEADQPVPPWTHAAQGFTSITRTDDELSIVCRDSSVPPDVRSEVGWALMKLHGPFAFSQVGILVSVAGPLAGAGIGIFAISTFDTDYILVKTAQLPDARGALIAAGHEIVD